MAKLSYIFEKFVKKSPVTVMTQALMERILSPDRLDSWFKEASGAQYTRTLLFSSVFELMMLVVCGTRKSICEAFQCHEEGIGVTLTSIYNKINGISPEMTAKLFEDTASEMAIIIRDIEGERASLLPGFTVKMLDGNCIEATDHRIKELREVSGGPLPGKSLVVYSPSLGIATNIFPCEDGHTQERALMPKVLKTVEANDLWVADRNFCTVNILHGINSRDGFYIIRQHKGFPFQEESKMKYVGKSDTGSIYEQTVSMIGIDGKSLTLRRIKIKLKDPTRDGHAELFILTNLPTDAAGAKKICEIYRERWKIETSFQHLEKNLNSEINALGYPKAALFGFTIALIASNLNETVMGSIRGVYGEDVADEEVSNYYIASEISAIHEGMMIIIPDEDWSIIIKLSHKQFIELLSYCTNRIRLRAFRKHKRGPKKPQPKRKDTGSPHVSTYKLISGRTK
jgi:hypothetical protein